MISSPTRRGMKRRIFISDGLVDQELDVGLSYGAATTLEKGKIATQRYESEDIEILEIPEEGRPITEPLAKGPATGEALVKTTATESTVPPEIASGDVPISKVDSPVNPTIKVSSTSTVAAEVTSTWRLLLLR